MVRFSHYPIGLFLSLGRSVSVGLEPRGIRNTLTYVHLVNEGFRRKDSTNPKRGP